MSVYFNGFRTSTYDRGGEEILTYEGTSLNAGEGLNPSTGIFTCPTGGTYMFTVHLATHKDKKAVVSLRKNGEDVASVISQDGKNMGNQMMGQSVLMDLTVGDEAARFQS